MVELRQNTKLKRSRDVDDLLQFNLVQEIGRKHQVKDWVTTIYFTLYTQKYFWFMKIKRDGKDRDVERLNEYDLKGPRVQGLEPKRPLL